MGGGGGYVASLAVVVGVLTAQASLPKRTRHRVCYSRHQTLHYANIWALQTALYFIFRNERFNWKGRVKGGRFPGGCFLPQPCKLAVDQPDNLYCTIVFEGETAKNEAKQNEMGH